MRFDLWDSQILEQLELCTGLRETSRAASDLCIALPETQCPILTAVVLRVP